MKLNIPKQFTQGDRVTWITDLTIYNPDSVTCYIRGASNPLDLIGVKVNGGWEFTLTEDDSNMFTPGRYQAQLVIATAAAGRQALGQAYFEVRPGFAQITELETRSPDEIELETISTAIAKLVSGAVAEYRIGDRMMRYQDLEQLTKRQDYLRKRVAIAHGKLKPGGRNVGVRFSSSN